MTDSPGTLEERALAIVKAHYPEMPASYRGRRYQVALAALTEAADEIASLRARVEAYRLLAVNEGWKHIMVEAYGHREYLRQRVEEVDRKAAGTVASGYDAAAYLRDALRDTPVE